MAVSENISREKKKGKKPPTFQHLPKNRAAKLKKDWIEKAKVKKQWKAQKRKEETSSTPMHRDVPPHQASNYAVDEEMDAVDAPKDEFHGFTVDDEPEGPSEGNATENTKGERKVGKEKEVRFAPERKESSGRPRQDAAPRKSLKERLLLDSQKKDSDTAETDEAAKPSLRELTRTAYSPASLHNVKSNHRHRHQHPQGSDSSKNWGKHQGSSGPRKGGQPNMRLRMEAMLEKIKRDYA